MTEMTILMLHKNVSRETSVKQLYYIILRKIHEFLLALRASQITVQLREHAQIPTRPARLLTAIRANLLTLRQSARWQQLAQSS